MIIYNKYTGQRDHTWYNSSNVVYSECIDSDNEYKTLKIIFKGGRTYLYKNVDVEDYIRFKNSESNGKAFNDLIKKYDCVRMPDTDMATLDTLKSDFMEEDGKVSEAMGNLNYELRANGETGEFVLMLNGREIFSGIEGQVSIIRLLKSMNIAYVMTELKNSAENGSESKESDGLD